MVWVLTRKWIDMSQDWALVWIAIIWLAVLAALHFAPATAWLTVDTITVRSQRTGAPIQMTVVREIHRPFFAEWTVVVRRAERGGWTQACPTGQGAADYTSTSVLPDPLTLDWWTDGACSILPPGKYQISSIWRMDPGGIWPQKIVQASSNTFEVTP